MKVILDTNVVISAVYFGGSPKKIIEHWIEQKFLLILSLEIADEYIKTNQVLQKKYEPIAEEIIQSLITEGEYYSPIKLKKNICKDRNDDKFLTCALASAANFIVTGDKLLLELKNIGVTKIVTPSSFLNIIK